MKSAALSTLAVAPLLLIVFLFNMADKLLVMVFVTLMAQFASSAAGAKAGMAMIIGKYLNTQGKLNNQADENNNRDMESIK